MQAPPDPCKVWSSCLDKCLEVLCSCVVVFTSVEEEAILQEIAQAEEGRNRLKCKHTQVLSFVTTRATIMLIPVV